MSSNPTALESRLQSLAVKQKPPVPLVAVVAVAVFLLGGGVTFLLTRGGDTKTAAPATSQATAPATSRAAAPSAGQQATTAAPSDVSAVLAAFQYPAGWSAQALTAADEKAGLALKLNRSGPDGSFLARRLDGKLVQPLDMAGLTATTQAALQAQIEGFGLVDAKQLKAGAQDYVQITYLQNTQPTEFTNRLVVIPTATRTFYLTFRSASGQWAQVERDAQPMTASFLAAVAR